VDSRGKVGRNSQRASERIVRCKWCGKRIDVIRPKEGITGNSTGVYHTRCFNEAQRVLRNEDDS
jgi:hypothetical protein